MMEQKKGPQETKYFTEIFINSLEEKTATGLFAVLFNLPYPIPSSVVAVRVHLSAVE